MTWGVGRIWLLGDRQLNDRWRADFGSAPTLRFVPEKFVVPVAVPKSVQLRSRLSRKSVAILPRAYDENVDSFGIVDRDVD